MRIHSSILWLLLAGTPMLARSVAAPKPVQVFVLAGQSNMEGQATVDLAGPDYNGGRGTLVRLMEDPVVGPKLRHLRAADGTWVVRNDVWVRYQREDEPLLRGPLTVGFTVYGDAHHFGPELQFGHVLGNHLEAPVLLVKTAWGGRSLFRDFRPPSSGGEVGPYYRLMISQVREAMARASEEFPGFQGAPCELAGFVWYHGWNDGVEPRTAVPAYETNLVNLIHDVRREFSVPRLPVVIGELTGPWVEAPPEWTQLRRAQAAVAARPEFAGTVAFAETRTFVRKPEDSPNPGHGHHEFGNAETYFLVGDALGRAMTDLLARAAPAGTPSPSPASTVRFDPVVQTIEGWTVFVDPALLGGAPDSVESRSLQMLANHLQRIRILVPPEPLAKLQGIGIWIERDHPVLKSMQYHPSADWLIEHGHDSRLARKVHITQARDLLSREQMLKHPAVVLHELAHGYHDQVLGFDNPEIVAAYRAAKASGTYDPVLLYTGERVRHYGMTDPMEYFAEGTEAYFYRNDFQPFVRAELKLHDPALHEVLSRVWEGGK